MDNDKITIMNQKLDEDQFLYFRLYNALYRINTKEKHITLQQIGLETTYKYKTLSELLEKHIVYGSNLLNSINDIKLV